MEHSLSEGNQSGSRSGLELVLDLEHEGRTKGKEGGSPRDEGEELQWPPMASIQGIWGRSFGGRRGRGLQGFGEGRGIE